MSTECSQTKTLAEAQAALYREALAGHDEVWLTVNGDSMAPLLRGGDCVRLRSLPVRPPRAGAVLVFLNHLHAGLTVHRLLRLVRVRGQVLYLTKGDATGVTDVLRSPDEVVGIAAARRRGQSTVRLPQGFAPWAPRASGLSAYLLWALEALRCRVQRRPRAAPVQHPRTPAVGSEKAEAGLTRLVEVLLGQNPVLAEHTDCLAVVAAGPPALAAPGDCSDPDLWLLCPDQRFRALTEELAVAGVKTGARQWTQARVANVELRYRVADYGALRQALADGVGHAFYLLRHGLVVRDPAGDFSALAGSMPDLPELVVVTQVEAHHRLLRRQLHSLQQAATRYEPLLWGALIQAAAQTALQLGCWLEGDPPAEEHRVWRQAQESATGRQLVPLCERLLAAPGAVAPGHTGHGAQSAAVTAAARDLQAGAQEAVARHGFGNLPLWHPHP